MMPSATVEADAHCKSPAGILGLRASGQTQGWPVMTLSVNLGHIEVVEGASLCILCDLNRLQLS